MIPFEQKYFKTRENNFIYKDKEFRDKDEKYLELLANSTTLYVGNLKYTVTEERVWALFSMTGEIRRVIFGVNRNDFRPCGFCFVEYYERKDAENAIKLFHGFRLDDLPLKCDIDAGYTKGREFGRGVFGGQVKRDLKRVKYAEENKSLI